MRGANSIIQWTVSVYCIVIMVGYAAVSTRDVRKAIKEEVFV